MTVSVRLTGRAARWVQLVQDFGHLDQDGVNRLLVTVADLHAESGGDGKDAVVDLPLVRRAAAVMLTSVTDDGQLPMILEEDWALLFS
ncbi:MAG: hypothetical protein ABMA64_41235 [Myxococcota bacterium]|jgi:hypothetical protein